MKQTPPWMELTANNRVFPVDNPDSARMRYGFAENSNPAGRQCYLRFKKV